MKQLASLWRAVFSDLAKPFKWVWRQPMERRRFKALLADLEALSDYSFLDRAEKKGPKKIKIPVRFEQSGPYKLVRI